MSETIQENSVPVQEISVKKKRVMSEAQKESLKIAREKAVLYRLQLKEEKEKMGIKDDKKLNKTQLKLLKLKEQREQKEIKEEEEEVGDGTSPSEKEEEIGDYTEGKTSPSEKKGDYTEGKTSPSVEVKEKVKKGDYTKGKRSPPVIGDGTPPVGDGRSPSTRPSFVRNENGFFCINMLI
jgi:hypothetical protein